MCRYRSSRRQNEPVMPGEAGWADAAMEACLRELPQAMTLSPEQVTVVTAWATPEDGFCVVYRHPRHAGRTLGYRARFMPCSEVEDPESFGFEVANFGVSEPLGSVEARLRRDVRGIDWHGQLDDELPVAPAL
jgi:hypothetical protein